VVGCVAESYVGTELTGAFEDVAVRLYGHYSTLDRPGSVSARGSEAA